jgi:hypothetical protein
MIHKGQVWETCEDVAVTCLTHWRLAFTGGYHRTLPKGERFRIGVEPPKTATAACCDPLNYRGLHKQMVPRKDRWSFATYAGYSLSISFEAIKKHCKLLETGNKAEPTV